MEFTPGLPEEIIVEIERLLRASRSENPEDCIDTDITAKLISPTKARISASCLGIKTGKIIYLNSENEVKPSDPES